MNDMQFLIEQMVSDISSHALRLDEIRLQSFLGWLESHSSRVKTPNQVNIEVVVPGEGSVDEQLRNALKGWFESLPLPGLLWEYHLLLNEIAWRREPSHMMRSQGRE